MYSFQGPPQGDGSNPIAGLINVNGTLYGTTEFGGQGNCNNGLGCGTVFAITTTGTESVLHSFLPGSNGAENPAARLLAVNGTLYGTTEFGGSGNCAGGCGTVFSITPSGTYAVLHSFGAGTDGATLVTLASF